MRINHNIAALNTYRQLGVGTNKSTKAMEKLSSGLRINRAGDDAAGLAISEKMRGQIRGLEQASRNAQDGISLIQTAEGALNESHSILQRMRELAVQSANDTNTDTDRVEIQTEVTQLAAELTRVAENTEFNTRNLLDGSFAGRFHIGANNGQNVELSISAMDAATLSVGTGGSTTTYDTSSASVSSITDGSGNANDVTISVGTYDGDNATGVAIDTALLTVGSTTTYDTSSASVSSITDGSGNANDVTIGVGAYDGDNATDVAIDTTLLTVTDITSYTSTDTKVENISGLTGDLSGLEITWADGDTSGDVQAGEITASGVAGWSVTGFTGTNGTDLVVSLENGTQTFDYNMGATSLVDATAVTIGDITGSVTGQTYGGTISVGGENVTVDSSTGIGSVAAGTYQGLTVDVSSVTAEGADSGTFDISGITSSTTQTYGGSVSVGGVAVTVDSGTGLGSVGSGTYQGLAVDVSSVTAAGADSGTFDISGITTSTSTSAVTGINVSTQADADAAITTIQTAIGDVSGERSKLGAFQNRLEHTIANLGTSSENLTAAESRIRDVDMAKEMMEFTKNNILQQAAQAMLAQANQQPQGVLQLLR